MTAHTLAGHFSVDASAKRIRHYRFVEERMMRTMGGWIALTPELSAKLVLGRHVWDCAQHADLWGKRLPELRAPAQRSEPSGEALVRFMAELASPEAFQQTAERLVGVYRVLKPCLLATYEHHLARANPVYEPPTRRILERCIEEERRHVAAGEAIIRQLVATPDLTRRAREWEQRLSERLGEWLRPLRAMTSFHSFHTRVTMSLVIAVPLVLFHQSQEHILETRLAMDIAQPASGREDLQRGLRLSRIAKDAVARALDADARAILAGDLGALERQVVPEARDAVMPAYRELAGGPVSELTLVASARLGGHWVLKQRLAGPDGVRLLQARWQTGERGWQVAEADIVRREPAP